MRIYFTSNSWWKLLRKSFNIFPWNQQFEWMRRRGVLMLLRKNDLTKKVQKLLWWSLDSCAVLWQKFRENNVFTTFDLTKYFSGQSNFSFSALFCKAVKCGKNKYFVKSIFVIIYFHEIFTWSCRLLRIDLTKKSGTISFPYILLQDPDQTFIFNTIIKQFWRIFLPNHSFLYRLPYDDIFGGVSAMTVEQFRKVNGFSNMFWGWGGEDDDMSNRLRQKKLYISRYPANIARYRMLKHSKDKANPDRFKYLYSGAKRIDKDGYNSLKYKPVKVELKRLYTWILVELPHLSV